MTDIQRFQSNARLSRVVVHNSVVYVAGVTATRADDDPTQEGRHAQRHHHQAERLGLAPKRRRGVARPGTASSH